MSDFEPTPGYSRNRTSTVFTNGSDEQRAEFTYAMGEEWTPNLFDKDKTSVLLSNGSDEQRAVVVYDLNGIGGNAGLEKKIIIKSETIPAADADSYGKFYCYSGATNNTYVHGYIYECIADVTTEYNIAMNPVDPEATHKLAFDDENHSPIELFERIASLSTPTFNPDDVKTGTFTFDKTNEIWYVNGYDADNNTLFENFTVNGTGDEYSLDAYGFVYIDHFPDNYEDGYSEEYELISHPSYSNYRWQRLDVQPVAEMGRYLSNWNAATGLAVTNPQENPYEYTTGDYYIVSVVASSGNNNYRPNGSNYVIGQASTTVESSHLAVNDTYLYDGTNWLLLKTSDAVTSINGETGDVHIKSVNGKSLMGAGNLNLTDIVTISGSTASQLLANDTIYNAGELTSLTITIPNSMTVDWLCQFNFTSGSTATTLTAPNTIKWLGDDVENNIFTPDASKRYAVMFYYDGVQIRGVVQSL